MKARQKRLSGLATQLITFASFFALVLGAVALGEYELITWQDRQSEMGDLHDTVRDVSDNVFQQGHWNLRWYRQWDNSHERSNFLVLSGTGQLVDIASSPSEDATDIVRSAIPVDKYLPRGPAYKTTDFGEKWLIENRAVQGGNVVGGISSTDLIGLSNPEALVAGELAKYGKTIESAENENSAAVGNFMSGVMAVTETGDLYGVTAGVVPLRVEVLVPDEYLDGQVHNFWMNGSDFNLLSKRDQVATFADCRVL